jgi:hypothetical protein
MVLIVSCAGRVQFSVEIFCYRAIDHDHFELRLALRQL